MFFQFFSVFSALAPLEIDGRVSNPLIRFWGYIMTPRAGVVFFGKDLGELEFDSVSTMGHGLATRS